MAKKVNRPATPAPAPAPAPPALADRPFFRGLYRLLPLLFFFAVCADMSRPVAVVCALLAFLLAFGRTAAENLRARLSPLTAAVLLYALVCLLSGLWSHFGDYALLETCKTLTAVSVFGIILLRVRAERTRFLLVSLNAVLALIALLCIDLATLQILSRGFSALMAFAAGTTFQITSGYEAGIRLIGIFQNANVSGGLLAIGLLISLYLAHTAQRARLPLFLCLGAEAVAFFLSFSMGAMLSFAVSCVVYLICAGRGRRLPLFLLMLVCAIFTVACSAAAFSFLGEKSPVPLLLALACGALTWAADRFVCARLARALSGRGKALGIAGGCAAVVIAAAIAAAFTVTGGVVLTPGGSLSRAVYPDAGAYTVAAEGADASVLIYSQNDAELMMHTQTRLYSGALDGAAFTVPADSRVVWFRLSGDGALSSVTLSDGTKLPLGYKLLPGFAANRLQGLRANQNVIQRFVFFRDGLRLWAKSPVLGWGVGGVEGQLTSVQRFYYESKYIHNQFIQIMDEAGIPGLLTFAAMLAAAIWMLARRRKESDPLLGALAACLAMAVVHSLTEVVWSTQMFQVVVFTLFAVLIIRCRSGERAAGAGAARAAGVGFQAMTLVFALLIAGNLIAGRRLDRLNTEGMTRERFVDFLKSEDRLDVYSDKEYKTNMMANCLEINTADSRALARRCAEQLRARSEYDACYYAAAYYYHPMRQYGELYTVMRGGLEQERSNPGAWNSAFHLYAQIAQQLADTGDAASVDAFLACVRATGDDMDAANALLMAPVSLDEGNRKLLDGVRGMTGRSGADALTALAAVLTA